MAHPPCQSCQNLNLTVEKFTITTDRLSGAQPTVQDLRRANERIEFANLEEIRSRDQQCPLCKLIARTLDGVNVESPSAVTCYLRWELDGRRSIDDVGRMSDYGTRRLRVCWSEPTLRSYDTYIVLGAQAEDFEININYRDRLNNHTQFLGRRIGPVAFKRNLIRQFLRLCEEDHDRRRCARNLGIEDPFSNTLREPYFGVIDIENDCIVPLPFTQQNNKLKFSPYATVSYVWGLLRSFKTTRSNVQSRRQIGGLAGVIPTLPRALRESIQLVHSIGIRYIWIDVLCIVQDSSHSWILNSNVMHLIYGNSTVTVCAADGNDGTTGLLAMDENHQPEQHIARYAEGVQLVMRQPSEASIVNSTWNRRAWTFQERLLSRCCLIFIGGRIHFQCRSTCLSEDIFADRHGQGWSLDLVRAPLQLLSQLKRRALWFYTHCVDLYTRRDLWEPFDILAAFSGMCKLIQGTTRAPFIFGLPASHFDFALLWVPVATASRLIDPQNPNDARYHDMKFPSWSWCGWKNQGMKYDPDIVGGCTEDLRSWLLDHTWIDWHIRDGHGTLRRLWDASYGDPEEDISIDERWRGYAVKIDPEGRSQTSNDDDDDSKSDGDSYHIPTESNTSSNQREELRPLRPHGRSSSFRADENIIAIPNRSLSRARRVRWHDQETTGHDSYGRPRSGSSMSPTLLRPRTDFKLTLPEDPYHVQRVEEQQIGSIELPDQHYLQFFTWRASFHVARTSSREEDPAPDLSRCHITDSRGDKCGSIVIDNNWLEEKEEAAQSTFEFIAISEAKDFRKHEFPDWTYYIPKEREESEWDLFFVLLVEYSKEEGIYRRVALGKIFKAAFARSDEEWKEIILG